LARATASRSGLRRHRHRLRRFAGSPGAVVPRAFRETETAERWRVDRVGSRKAGHAYAHDGARPWEAGSHALPVTARAPFPDPPPPPPPGVASQVGKIARGVSGHFRRCAGSRGVARVQLDRSTPLGRWPCRESLRTRTGSVQLGIINALSTIIPEEKMRKCRSVGLQGPVRCPLARRIYESGMIAARSMSQPSR
jgi:hypothetical protein